MSTILQQIAARLGLPEDPASKGILSYSRLRGQLDGQTVTCAATDRGLQLEALFEPALDLGLDITTRQLTIIPTFGRKVSLDDSSFDDELDATADDPRRAAGLFSDSLRGAILGLNATNLHVAMKDDRVTVTVPLFDLKAALDGLPKLARIAALVAEARRHVEAAEQLGPYLDALVAFGGPRGLRFEKTPLSAAGTLRDVAPAVRCARRGRGAFDMEVRATPVDGAAGMGLLVRRESMLDRARTLLGGQDLRTGDAVFDAAFLVQAQEAERATLALDGDVRALMLELRGRFDEVTLVDAGLTLRGPVQRLRPRDVEMVLEAASTVVQHVARASGAVLRGPYR